MNMQEIFNKVATHLLTQGQPSIGVYGCMYRADNGLKCAVGCLIKDEHYHDTMEIQGISAVEPREAVLRSLGVAELDSLTWEMLAYLQRVHDNIVPEDWEERLKQVAKQYNLEMPQ